MIPYYQWVPMILLVQALLFYLPIAVWRSVCGHSGLDVASLVSCGLTFSSSDLSHSRETMLNYMTKQMDRFLTGRIVNRSITITAMDVVLFPRFVC